MKKDLNLALTIICVVLLLCLIGFTREWMIIPFALLTTKSPRMHEVVFRTVTPWTRYAVEASPLLK